MQTFHKGSITQQDHRHNVEVSTTAARHQLIETFLQLDYAIFYSHLMDVREVCVDTITFITGKF